MFGLLNTGKIVLMILPFVLAGGGYFYINNLKDNIELLEANQAVMESAVASKDAEISRLQENVEEIRETSRRVIEEREKLAGEVDVLRNKLKEHDLGYLAENKPGLVERIINKDIENNLKSDILEIMREEND